MDINKLAFFGAREKIKSLMKEKREIDSDINDLKKFLKSGKTAFVEKVKKRGKYKTRMTKIRRRKISPAGLKAMRINAAKARAAKMTKQMAKKGFSES